VNQQEMACAIWLTRGKRVLEIAKILKLKPGTVRNYLNRAKYKFNANTLAQALYEAVRYSYVLPKEEE
jgi:DNA-binding CsgD family transcriptional regulator